MGSRQVATNTQQIVKEFAKKMGYKADVLIIPKSYYEKARKVLVGIIFRRGLSNFYYKHVCKILEIPLENDTETRN